MPRGQITSGGVRRRIPGLTLVEHEFSTPLDHADDGGEELMLFARELIGDSPGARELSAAGVLPGRSGLRGAPGA